MPTRLVVAGLLLSGALALTAQSTIGTVRTDGAQVQGNVSVGSGHATLQNTGTVSAGSSASDIALSRGGSVRVCAGSVVALSRSTAAGTAASPLLIALQRGAVEIQTKAVRADAILTPDMRLELSGAAPLDLRLRINPAGDTCVENLGRDAPILHVTEQFSGAGYIVKAGQRILFEHGSVREVVDHQSYGCGCPKSGGKDDFPEAVSAGLAAPDVPAVPAGTTHVQVSTGIDYNGNNRTASGPPNPDGTLPSTTLTPAVATSASTPSAAVQAAQPAPPSPAKPADTGNPFSAIGRFFRHLFGGKS